MSESESSHGRREVSRDVCQDYQAWLQGLTLNSKSTITKLTVLAQQNVVFASSIVSLVEAQMAKAPPSQKLPVMYLMDSIIKNVGGEYLKAFALNLVEMFLSVFEKVDTNTRKSLFLLRSTWNKIFPLEKLHALDVRVKSLDPAWPVKPLPPDGNASGPPPEESPAPACARAGASAPPALAETPKPLPQEQLLKQQVLEKEKQLLELRKKILELEQAQAQLTEEMTSAQLEAQGRKQRRASARKGPAEAQPPATHSPQELERRALKRRLRSLSPISSSPKIRKLHQIGPKQSQVEEDTQATRGGRNSNQSNGKAEVQDQRAVNRAHEGNLQGTASQHPAKASPDPECAENWDGAKSGKRWNAGWEENPNSQQGEEHQALAECPQEIRPAVGRILSRQAPKQQHCLGLRFEGPPGQPLRPHYQARCELRFEGSLGHPFLPHGQPGGGIRFEEPRGQPLGPQGLSGQFDTEIPLRFDGCCQPASGFDLPLGLQGVPFQNMAPHAPSRLGMSPCGQGGPFVQHPWQGSHQPCHRMQLQSTAGPGAQDWPWRAGAPHWDAKAPQGPQHGSFRNMSMGSHQAPVTFAQPGPCGQAQQYWPHPGSLVQNPAGALPLSHPDSCLGQLHVNELFAKLLSAGILHLPNLAPTSAQGNEPSAQPGAEGKAAEQKEDVPDLTDFQVKELRQRYSSAINALHTGIQCGSCGVRLATSQGYAEHLDWHYRRNRRQRAASRAAAHRQWYCSSAEWIEFTEAADLEKTAKSQIFERARESMLKARQAAKKDEIQSVAAGPAGAAESCEICQEQFDQYWDDEEEEWRLRNAIRVDAKIYHPSCYTD